MNESLEWAYLDEAVVQAGWRGPGEVLEEAAALEASLPGQSDAALRALAGLLGAHGVLRLVLRGRDGGRFDEVSWRAVCLARERLGHASPLLELAFAMQGLGSYAISRHGDDTQRAHWLPGVAAGTHIAGFALTEPNAGSDLGGIETTATRQGDDYVLDGHKVFISNAPIGDVFTLFAATAPKGARRRLSAFILPGDAPGLHKIRTEVLGGHPIGELRLDGVRVPSSLRLGEEGDGMKIALGTLHRFRTTVGAAALGFAQRALDETVRHVASREQFGRPLADLQAVQMGLADMACELEAARLLVYRAAKRADDGAGRDAEARAGSMAKLMATEAASRIVDTAVQLHGGRGVLVGSPVARLYEEVRALRIYEGASDIQRMLIARHLLRDTQDA